MRQLVCWCPATGADRHTHLRSYRGSLATRAGKAQSCTGLRWEPEERAYVYYTSVVVPVFSVETRIMCIYVHYPLVSLPGDPLRSHRENLKQWFPRHVYHLGIRDTEFCLPVFPAIWSRSEELQSVSVTFVLD